MEEISQTARQQLYVSLLRRASGLCGSSCINYKSSNPEGKDGHLSLTDGEHVCIDRCIKKFLKTRGIMEEILN